MDLRVKIYAQFPLLEISIEHARKMTKRESEKDWG